MDYQTQASSGIELSPELQREIQKLWILPGCDSFGFLCDEPDLYSSDDDE